MCVYMCMRTRGLYVCLFVRGFDKFDALFLTNCCDVVVMSFLFLAVEDATGVYVHVCICSGVYLAATSFRNSKKRAIEVQRTFLAFRKSWQIQSRLEVLSLPFFQFALVLFSKAALGPCL